MKDATTFLIACSTMKHSKQKIAPYVSVYTL